MRPGGKALWVAAVCGLLGAACSSGGVSADGSAEEGVVESDARPDGEVDFDDGRPDVVPEADGDGDADRDADADVDDASDAPDDAEFDADSLLPRGCRFPRPLARFMWAARNSMDEGKLVWMWLDDVTLPSKYVLTETDLASRSEREVHRRTYPERIYYPAVHGDTVVFVSETIGDEASSQEIFAIPLSSGSETQITHNAIADGDPIAGHDFVVYESLDRDAEGVLIGEFRYADLAGLGEHVIVENTALSEVAFDGHHWVAMANAYQLHKFDLLDPGAGVQPLTGGSALYSHGLSFDRDTGTLVASTNVTGVTDDYRLEVWDVAAGTMAVLLDEPWSQVFPDVDGHVVVYQDSQAAGESYGEHQRSDLRIVDRDTGVKRTVMPLDTYYGVGIWERWIAFNNYGMYGDSLIICDLVEAGYMDVDLHVVPE